MSVVESARSATLRRRGGGSPTELFVLVAAALLMGSMQMAMITVALPDMVADFDVSVRWVSWAISVFTMAQAVSLPLMGKLSDTVGRRTVFMGGAFVFGMASLACAMAPTLPVLIAARAVQGMAAGSLLPSAYGVVGDAFTGPSRTRVMGLISSVMPIGAIVGPNLGGFLVEAFGWRSTFMVNVPLSLVVVAWGLMRLPAAPASRRHGRMDVVGAVLLTLTVGLVIISLTELGKGEAMRDVLPVVAGALLVALAIGAVFARHERRTSDPLLDLTVLARRDFVFLNSLNFLYGVCIFGMVSFIPLYVQERYALSASEAGLLLTPRAAGMVLASVVASMIVHRTGFRLPILVGLGGLLVASLLLGGGETVVSASSLAPLVYLGLVIGLVGVSLGTAGPSVNQSGLDLLPDQVAAITGMRGMFRALGGVVGTAAMAAMAAGAPDPAQGLERAFLALGVVAVAGMVMVRGIPDRPALPAPVVKLEPERALVGPEIVAPVADHPTPVGLPVARR
ncbi:MAG: MFS transporter [Acidimicrobiales bacterium]